MQGVNDYLSTLEPQLGQSIGVTDWFAYDQAAVDRHGANCGDEGPIHNAPEWAAANTPFGGTLVQGSLLLSSLSKLAKSVNLPKGDLLYRLNYGFNRVRFVSPVKTGANFRGCFILKEVSRRGPLEVQLTMEATIKVEGESRPALVADWLAYMKFNT